MKRDNPWKQHENRDEQLQVTGEQDTFLSFGQVLGAERTLDDVLIERPIKQVGENHPGKDGQERDRVVARTDGVQFLWVRRRDRLHPIDEVTVTEGDETERRDKESDDDESNPVQRIRHGDGAKAAEDGVDCPDYPDEPDDHPERLFETDAE